MAEEPSDTKIEAWARLVRTSHILLSAVEADLKSDGFPPLAWYDALLELDRAEEDGLRPFELQDRMLLAQYGLSRLVDRLVTSGYAERHPCEDDRRGHILTITRRGRLLLHRMWPAYAKAIDSNLGRKISEADASNLNQALRKLIGQG